MPTRWRQQQRLYVFITGEVDGFTLINFLSYVLEEPQGRDVLYYKVHVTRGDGPWPAVPARGDCSHPT